MPAGRSPRRVAVHALQSRLGTKSGPAQAVKGRSGRIIAFQVLRGRLGDRFAFCRVSVLAGKNGEEARLFGRCNRAKSVRRALPSLRILPRLKTARGEQVCAFFSSTSMFGKFTRPFVTRSSRATSGWDSSSQRGRPTSRSP